MGMVRRNNEDACMIVPPWSSLAISKGACMFAVADGMGGQNAGEVASAITMKESALWFENTFNGDTDSSVMEEMVGQINAAVWSHAQKHPEASGMGNTLTLLIAIDGKATVAHIGDSRLYRLRDGVLEQLTNDHTLVAEQVRMGKLSAEEARKHPSRHILSRAIGSRQFVVPDILQFELKKSDIFLLCSDGVSGMLEDSEIRKIIADGSPDASARLLVEAANKAGGKDNSTAIVVSFDEVPVTLCTRYSLTRWIQKISGWRNTGTV